MKRTIIFMSGLMVPKWLAKSKFVWNDFQWKNYQRIYLTSKIPLSDNMVKKELDRLCYLTNTFSNVIVAGQSLGAWWAANLACQPNSNIKKMVLWTPLSDTNAYPIFNVSSLYHPLNRIPNPHNIGPHRSLVAYSKEDYIVPWTKHVNGLLPHFDPIVYPLNGGHLLQSNHKAGLSFMKDWIELD